MRVFLSLVAMVLVPLVSAAEAFDASSQRFRASASAGVGRFDPYAGPALGLQLEAAPWSGRSVPVFSVASGMQLGGEFGRGLVDASIGLRRVVDAGVFGRPAFRVLVGGGLFDGSPALSVRGSVSAALFRVGPLGVDGAFTARTMLIPGAGFDVPVSAGLELGVGF